MAARSIRQSAATSGAISSANRVRNQLLHRGSSILKKAASIRGTTSGRFKNARAWSLAIYVGLVIFGLLVFPRTRFLTGRDTVEALLKNPWYHSMLRVIGLYLARLIYEMWARHVRTKRTEAPHAGTLVP